MDSTNARARELAEAGAPHGTVVTAAEQTAGRGRQGRTWTAPAGKALLYSAIVRPLDHRHDLLPLTVPLAVCEAAETLAPGIECQIKWPNDIWIEGRKLAGVLIEARPPNQTQAGGKRSQDGWAVIGVGLNLSISPSEFPPDLRDTAISLFDLNRGSRGETRGVPREAAHRREIPAAKPLQHSERSASEANPGISPGVPSTPTAAATVLSRHLDRWVSADPDETLAGWRARDALRGRQVAWDGGSGVADGVDDRGHLAVALSGGGRALLGAGDVHLRL